MKKFIEDNFIVIAFIVLIAWGLFNFMSTPADRESGCTEYETTSQGTYCVEGEGE